MKFLNLSPLITVIMFMLAAVSASFGQRLVEGSAPSSASIGDFGQAFCSSLKKKIEVCKVRTSKDGDSVYEIFIHKKSVRTFEAPYWTSAMTSPEDFTAYYGDMDSDGSKEIVVVSFDGASNGMGVTYSTAYIFRDPARYSKDEPVQFKIQEFGHRDTFKFDNRLRRTTILITQWKGYRTLDPRRGWGTYLVGKWFRYNRGKLEPMLDRPTLARRFLFRFQNERDNGWFQNRFPFKWLQDRTTHKFFREPAEPARLESSYSGVLSAYNFDDERSCVFTIQLDNGKMASGLCEAKWNDPKNDQRIESAKFGILKSQYLFPDDFNLSNSLPLIGLRVRLENYVDEYNSKYSIVWLRN